MINSSIGSGSVTEIHLHSLQQDILNSRVKGDHWMCGVSFMRLKAHHLILWRIPPDTVKRPDNEKKKTTREPWGVLWITDKSLRFHSKVLDESGVLYCLDPASSQTPAFIFCLSSSVLMILQLLYESDWCSASAPFPRRALSSPLN